MDVEMRGEGGATPDSPEDTLSGIESKKHRMHTGQDSEGFARRYQLLEQLGSGASGTVWKCRLAPGQGTVGGRSRGGDEPVEGVIYAAKIIDLRPFKLRERFSMQRLMREVDIMRRLRHPNIIRLVEALDTPEQLVLVLEYAPGVELFDAILSKTSFSEEEARPVFVQVARALQYMHSMQIVHRDVKPENVMIIDKPTKGGLYPEAKLLDFGLSKAIDADTGGSVARTFVGTPSYLAPEVEEKQGGRGKPYGTPVDCWSLGAMLYVMLVARFPEFQIQGKRKYIRMKGPLWDKVSAEAKELIQRLMAFDPGARLTVGQALRHPWLGELAAKEAPPSPLQQPASSGMMAGMAPLPEDLSFSIPPAVVSATSAGAATVSRSGSGGGISDSSFDSPAGDRASQQGASRRLWGGSGRPPIVTEQQTPPAASAKKSFEFTPSGPTIRELNGDESPLSSLDSGMGDPVVPTTKNNNSNSNSNSNENNTMNSNNKEGVTNGAGSGNSNVGGGRSGASGGDGRAHETAMVSVYGSEMGLAGPPDGGIPLLQLQTRITACLETAVTTYSECPEAAASLRRSATLCRESLRDSVTLLRKIERTAAQVITLFPDLTLAVEEGEPDLAHDFFSTVKGWVREMYTAVSLVQARNTANAEQVSVAMKLHAKMGLEKRRRKEEEKEKELQEQSQRQQQQKIGDAATGFGGGGGQVQGGDAFIARRQNSVGLSGHLETDAARQSNLIEVDADTFEVVRQIQALRSNLDQSKGATSSSSSPSTDESATPTKAVESISDEKLINLFLLMARGSQWQSVKEGGAKEGSSAVAVGGSAPATRRPGVGEEAGGAGERVLGGVEAMFAVPSAPAGSGGGSGASGGVFSGEPGRPASVSSAGAGVDEVSNLTAQMSIDGAEVEGEGEEASSSHGVDRVSSIPDGVPGTNGPDNPEAWKGMQLARRDDDKIFSEVQRALQMLHEVDSVLEQLALFWANSEVIFDVLLRKGDLVEKFVAFANKPRLLQRFRERLADYKRFWEGVQGVCNKYVCGQLKCTGCSTGNASTNATGAGAGGSEGRGGNTYHPHSEDPSVDGSFGSSGRRNNSNSSAGSAGPEGLGGAGGWAQMEMGMDADRRDD